TDDGRRTTDDGRRTKRTTGNWQLTTMQRITNMQNNRWLQVLIILLVIIASAWLAAAVWGFLLQFSSILLLFFLSWLIAFILRPMARWLHKRGMPHTLS